MKIGTTTLVILMLALLTQVACSSFPQTSSSDSFNLEKLIVDVFDPQPGEKVLVMVDLPHGSYHDNQLWEERREMAEEWHLAFEELGEEIGFSVHPLLTYPATGMHNGPLPEMGDLDGNQIHFSEIFADTNIVVALTEFSATAPLIEFSQTSPDLRVASMPTVMKSMEQTALSADYSEVARKGNIVQEMLDQAVGARLEFSTGHEFYFDLRFRTAEIDDGQLHADKEGLRVINLPSGEAFIAPYEGEIEGEASQTSGTIPLLYRGKLVLILVEQNQIVEVSGENSEADLLWDYISSDPARQNIAELGIGVNDKAVITGNVLEDEKVFGVHWAFGRSDHIGGTVGVEDFLNPRNVVHQDFVYPLGGEIEVVNLTLVYEDGSTVVIILDGEFIIF
jgi:hypothetical protein